jgi:hypothetical protein
MERFVKSGTEGFGLKEVNLIPGMEYSKKILPLQ